MRLPIHLSEDSKEPIYHQIESQIQLLIVGGHLPPGTLLPSIRALSGELACSVITTRRAYQNLEQSGFIKTVQGKGTFVTSLDKELEKATKERRIRQALIKTFEESEQLGMASSELQAICVRAIDEWMRRDSR